MSKKPCYPFFNKLGGGCPHTHRILRVFFKFGPPFLFFNIVFLTGVWLVFGSIGLWVKMEPDHPSFPERFLRIIYGLFTILLNPPEEFLADGPHLGLARFGGLAAATTLAVAGLSQWTRKIIPTIIVKYFLHKQITLIGLGGAGRALLHDLSSNPNIPLLLAIDKDPFVLQSIRAAFPGVLCLEGNAEDPNFFKLCATHRSSLLFISTGHDGRNLRIAGRIRQDFILSKKKIPISPRIVPLLNDPFLLARHNHNSERMDTLKIYPFRSDLIATENLLRRLPPPMFSRILSVSRVNVIIMGFGSLGETMLIGIIKSSDCPNLFPPKITVLTKDASKAETDFIFRHPEFDPKTRVNSIGNPCVEIVFLEFDPDCVTIDLINQTRGKRKWPSHKLNKIKGEAVNHPLGVEKEKELGATENFHMITGIYICFEDDELNLRLAFRIQQIKMRTGDWNAPTFVRLTQDSGFENLLSPYKKQMNLFEVVEAFGLDKEVCTKEGVFPKP